MVPTLLVYVSLALPPALTAEARRIAIAEIAAIWSAHGVVVTADRLQPGAPLIQVVVERRPAFHGSDWIGPLASIRFDGAGMPEPEIRLYLPNLLELLARSTISGSGGDQWPAIVRERAVGRAVGRVLAHEVGHYVLRSRWHARSGLMRPVHSAADLVGAERALFRLSRFDVERLAVVAASVAAAAADETDDCFGASQ
jgi:hypothetical protein